MQDSRPAPIPAYFVRMLREHNRVHGTAPDGRLFRTNIGGLLEETGYGEARGQGPRKKAMSKDEATFLLAWRTYDFRHARLSI